MNRTEPRLQVILFLAAFFALWTIRATWLIRFDQSIQSSEIRVAFATLVKVLLWTIPAALFGYWARRANPIQYLGLSVLPKTKTWAICLLAISLFCILILSFELLVGHKSLSLGTQSVASIPSKISIFVVSPFVEEMLFRGLILKELSAFVRPAISNIVASILFVGIHLPYWISSGVQLREIASTSIGILLFSLFAGWLYSFSKSIWPPTAAHITNNILSSLISAR